MAWCQRSPRGCHPWPIEASLTSCISAGCTGTVSWKLENMETIGNPNVFLGPSGRTSWCRLQGVDLCQLLCPGDGESDEVGREKWGGMEQVRSDPWQHFAQRNLLKMIRFTKNNGKNFHIDYFHYFYNSKVFHYFSNPVFHGLFHGSFLYYMPFWSFGMAIHTLYRYLKLPGLKTSHSKRWGPTAASVLSQDQCLIVFVRWHHHPILMASSKGSKRHNVHDAMICNDKFHCHDYHHHYHHHHRDRHRHPSHHDSRWLLSWWVSCSSSASSVP